MLRQESALTARSTVTFAGSTGLSKDSNWTVRPSAPALPMPGCDRSRIIPVEFAPSFAA